MPATIAKPQRARMFRVSCEPCGIIAYMSRAAIGRGVPVCGNCGEKMAPGPKIHEYERSKER
jgi:formylmethanofuran dehydrogenase subunit E